jgi:hypothetical protein
MARHIVARTSDISPGGNKVANVDGRDIVVFHVNGEFFALLNRCPARRRAAGKGRLRGAADLAGARRLPALPRRRIVALSLARLGIRHAQRAVLVRSQTRQGPVLSGRDREWPGTC